MNKKLLSSLVFISIFSSAVSAKTIMIGNTPVEIGEIVANGAGCPVGSVTATATNDNTQVAILFGQYSALTSATVPVAFTNCNLAIPLSVGKGFSVGIVDIDWRGSVLTGPGTFVNFHREFFFTGNTGPVSDSTWTDGGFENFLLEDRPSFVHYSGCDGEELIARADTSATVVGPGGLFSLRAADVMAELLFTVVVTPCDIPLPVTE